MYGGVLVLWQVSDYLLMHAAVIVDIATGFGIRL
jgi:hypothetical protein